MMLPDSSSPGGGPAGFPPDHDPRRARTPRPVHGAGLGLRRNFLTSAIQAPPALDFLELAPENWIGVGGALGRKLRFFTERYPVVAHGLSLSIGGPTPLDRGFLGRLKAFLDQHGIRLYSDHLSYCSDDGQLYDLLPIPFTDEAVEYVATRIRQVQETLERRIAIENASYYVAPGRAMEETDFVNAVLERADCDLLLDVNNVFVNSINHRYDPIAFLERMPADRITYVHIAGHYVEAEDLRVDTHGCDVCDPVWRLLEHTYARFGTLPTLLERDFDIPPLPELMREIETVRQIQARATGTGNAAAYGPDEPAGHAAAEAVTDTMVGAGSDADGSGHG